MCLGVGWAEHAGQLEKQGQEDIHHIRVHVLSTGAAQVAGHPASPDPQAVSPAHALHTWSVFYSRLCVTHCGPLDDAFLQSELPYPLSLRPTVQSL